MKQRILRGTLKLSFWHKLMSGAAVVMALICVLLLQEYNHSKEAEHQQIRLRTEVVKPLGEVGKLQFELYRLRVIVSNLAQSKDYFSVAAEISQLEKQINSYSTYLHSFAKQHNAVYSENMIQIEQKWKLLKHGFEKIIEAASQMNEAEVERLATYQAYPRFIALINEQKHLANQIEIDAESVYQQSVDDLQKQRNQFIFVSLTAIFVGALLLFLFARYLSNRVNYLHSAFQKVAEGQVHYAIEVKGNDELADLASAFNTMIEKVATRQDALERASEVLEEKIAQRTLELAEKNKELEYLAITDRLTDLHNRRSLDEKLIEELERHRRTGHGFGVILLDMDHFKSVNDNYGHKVGDDVLKDVAQILNTQTRCSDFVGRWGGEEFLIICPEIDRFGLSQLTKKICGAIELHEFPVVGSKTASFGTAIIVEGDCIESIVGRADEALYRAKENGRNRVEMS